MSVRFIGLLLIVGGCTCHTRTQTVESEPLRVSPDSLAFGDTYVGHPSTLRLELTAPGPASRTVRLAVDAPYSVEPPELVLPASESFEIQVTFSPAAPGVASAALLLLDDSHQQTLSIPLTGNGLSVPVCASQACRVSAFSPREGRCVDGNLADGTQCASPLTCFTSARCLAGECVGATVTCDDGNPCTVDVCSQVGCGQVDRTPFCPTSPNPCLAPSCSPDVGCGFAKLDDGTACGERTCTSAWVCIAGNCVQRTPPKTQACVDVLIGVPAGKGFVDGRASDARFGFVRSLVVDGEDLVFLDTDRIRKLSHGLVTTIAGRSPPIGIVDGIGANASLSGSNSGWLAPTNRRGLYFLGDGSTVRLVTSQGLVTTLAGQPDAGGATDGVGKQARLSVQTALVSRGDRVLFAQYPSLTREPSPLLIREVDLSGQVRTLVSHDLQPLITDAGVAGFLTASVWDAPEGLHVGLTLTDHRTSEYYSGPISDGGLVLQPSMSGIEWVAGVGTDVMGCGIWLRSVDGGIFRPSECLRLLARDGDGGAYVYSSTAIEHLSPGTRLVLAGPTPDRRNVDGDRDAGRLAYPRELAVLGESVYFLDSRPTLVRSFGPMSGTRPLLETLRTNTPIDEPWSLATHAGQLWVMSELGRLMRLESTSGLLVVQARFRQFGDVITIRSNGSLLLGETSGSLHSLELDGGATLIPNVLVHSFAPGPAGTWAVHGRVEDAGPSPFAQLLRMDASRSFSVLAGDPNLAVEKDGPALQAGIPAVIRLTVAPDGTVYFLGQNNSLRQVRNGTVSTLMNFSDTPYELIALGDGSLVVAVDSALLQVLP